MSAEPMGGSGANAPIMQSRSRERVVIVLAKAPIAGRAKTRLTPPASPEGAAQVAAAALLDTLDAARAVPGAEVLVALAGDVADAERADEIVLALAGTTVVPQRGDALGERIEAAHADTARLFPGAATVQIGMDTPQVSAALLDDALTAVETGGWAALGLALDGGWWALALRDPARASLVVGVPASRDDTGALTWDALCAGGPAEGVRSLPVLSDVDTAADAVAVSELAPHGRFALAVGDLLTAPGGLPR